MSASAKRSIEQAFKHFKIETYQLNTKTEK